MTAPRRIGFIGCGKMGGALAKALAPGAAERGETLVVFDRKVELADSLALATGAHRADGARELFATVDLAFLAVKPQDMPFLVAELSPVRPAPRALVSIAAGVGLEWLRSRLDGVPSIIRAMPNRPALVFAGITALMGDEATPGAAVDEVEELFRAAGQTVRLTAERDFDAVTALSGSGPAFVFRLVEGLVQGGVAAGLSEAVAERLAKATVFGAGKILVDLDTSAAAERQAVSSPGGTTMAGLAVLDRRGFYEAIVEAIAAARQRSRELKAT